MRSTLSAGITGTALLVLCSGCTMNPGWSEGGNLASTDSYTYVSRSHTPQTITLVDVRTNEVIWSRDVPVNKQLSIKFYEGFNSENPSRPDVMRYAIQDTGERWSRLTDSITVPPSSSRRLDVELRDGPEFPR